MVIKFRAYDKLNKKIYVVRGIEFDLITQAITSIHCNEFRKFGKTIDFIGEFGELNNVDIMQFTGMYDKVANKELYEKDIIKFKTNSDYAYECKEYVGVISWGEYCYEVDTNDSYIPCLNLVPRVIDFDTIVKLGNIYENPELLTNQNPF